MRCNLEFNIKKSEIKMFHYTGIDSLQHFNLRIKANLKEVSTRSKNSLFEKVFLFLNLKNWWKYLWKIDLVIVDFNGQFLLKSKITSN